jgi:hypothetical protein
LDKSKILGANPAKPRGLPELGTPAIANLDLGSRDENIMVIGITGGPQPDPRLVGVKPFIPRPPKAKSSDTFVKIKHSEAAILLALVHKIPVYLAFSTYDLVTASPKESTSKHINLLLDFHRKI